jgi:3-oxoacyl-[acyl-carrier protein] reductase
VFSCDVSNEDNVKEMVNNAIERFGTIDILINNAGIFKDAITWKMEKSAWDEVISTNLTGAFLCAKHVLPIMRARGWGRIVNISSIVGQVGVPGTCNYAAAKSGLFGLTKTIARECANKNITVNCVALGYFESGMNLRLPEEIRNNILNQIPMKRFGKPEEAASLVLFLCTEEAGYITGQIIHVNGGLYM